MSVIERALEKLRSTPQAVAPPARRGSTDAAEPVQGQAGSQPLPGAPVRPAVARHVEAPRLAISEQMLSDIGVRAPTEQLHQQNAEYRHIKRQLLAQIRLGSTGSSRLLLVASALSGEGKTFTAANLSLSLALEPDYSVLLVDADVIKPNLTRLFGLTEHKGLMDAATNPDSDVEDFIVTTNIDGLSILPAGQQHPNATEHFASLRTQQIFKQLLEAPNRIVVVDSLPLLLTTESRALLPHADQVLLVIRAQSTPRQALMRALDLMPDDTNVKLLLNAIERFRLGDYYGYGQGYVYNYAERVKHD